MNAEMMELRARVAALERALAVATSTNRAGERRRGTTMVVFALASAAVMVTLLFLTAPIPLRAAGPTTVTAPFTVVDGSGRLLLRVLDDPNRGAVVSLYNAASRGVVEIGASSSGCCGTVRVYNGADNGQPRAMMGVQEDDTGGLRLAGPGNGVTQVTGKGLVIANSERKPIAMLRNDSDVGYLQLRNSSGATSADLSASDAGGALDVNEASGKLAARIEAAGGPGKMTIFGAGAAKTTIGVSADNAGLLRLDSAGGNSVMLHGVGAMKTMNPGGKEVVDIGVDPHGNGSVDVRPGTGVGGVRLDVSETGAGNLKVHTPPFEIMAQIGIKEAGRGDVCVMGRKGLLCLSGVAAKSLIPW
jgi:hypothetical protein